MLMQFLRKSAVGLVLSSLFSLLLTFGLALGVQRVLGTPTVVKQSLKQSGIYQTFVANALDQAQKEQSKQPGAEAQNDQIPINQPEVRAIIQQAASPAFLQTQTEQALDSTYAWLQGKSPHLNVTIDLTDVKTRLADGLGKYAEQRFASLPACTSRSTSGSDVDPFNATCVPKGFSASQAAAQAKNQILNGEFLKDTKFTADSLKLGNGKTLEQQLQAAPIAYQRANQGVYGLGLLVLLLAMALVFLSVTRRSGLKKLAVTFITIGLLSILIGWLSGIGMNWATDAMTKTTGSGQPLQQSLLAVAKQLVSHLRTWWMGYGILLTVLGTGTLVALRFIKPKMDEAPTHQPTPSNSPQPNPTNPTPQLSPKPTKKLVQ